MRVYRPIAARCQTRERGYHAPIGKDHGKEAIEAQKRRITGMDV